MEFVGGDEDAVEKVVKQRSIKLCELIQLKPAEEEWNKGAWQLTAHDVQYSSSGLYCWVGLIFQPANRNEARFVLLKLADTIDPQANSVFPEGKSLETYIVRSSTSDIKEQPTFMHS